MISNESIQDFPRNSFRDSSYVIAIPISDSKSASTLLDMGSLSTRTPSQSKIISLGFSEMLPKFFVGSLV